jgi:hypothetical protein
MELASFPNMTDELPALPTIPLGRYRHYKGGEYEVVGVVRHSESLDPLVLYRPLDCDSGSWVRPYAMFVESVEHLGKRQPRFAFMAETLPTQVVTPTAHQEHHDDAT